MTLCRWFGDTWLGAFFFRVLGHRWEHAGIVGPYLEEHCERCGAWRHADTYDGAMGIRDAYVWARGRAPLRSGGLK